MKDMMNTPADPAASGSSLSWERWLEVDDATLTRLLEEHGQDITTLESNRSGNDTQGPEDHVDVVPLPVGWLRLSMGGGGEVVGQLVSDPVEQYPVDAPVVFAGTEIDELRGWVTENRDIFPTLGWWYRLLRDPERERYAVAVHERDVVEPRLVIIGVYPDVVLCEADSPAVAFVEPHPDAPGRARARLLPITAASLHDTPRVLAEGPAGGVKIERCSTRRFIKVGHGVRSSRVWQLFDTARPDSQAMSTPAPVHDPDLIDVALFDGKAVLVQATNESGQWHVDVGELTDGGAQEQRRAATGRGEVRKVIGGDGSVLVHVNRTDVRDRAEHLCLVPVADSAQIPEEPEPVLSSPGTFALNLNICATSVGFAVAELRTGTPPVIWYLDTTGRVLNPSNQSGPDVHFAYERFASPDGYQCSLDIRWRGDSKTFHGPVIFMVYGAYGIDIDLDSDQGLDHWLDRGYAVATAHVRGGGDAPRHRAGSRNRRDRSLADAIAAVEWLRSGRGAATATKVCVIGVSAGGFLVASLLAEETVTVDAAVIVNGYIDPLEALLRRSSPTEQADRDEWGDPEHDLGDREALEKLSPLRKLTTPPAPTLVAVSGRDARVDPRQGLAWVVRSRELGGNTTLWYDPNGTHDMGIRVEVNSLVDWVVDALEQHEAR